MKRRARHGQRGIGLVAMAVWIVALAVIMAVAVDVARLSHTAGEVQTIADAAALAGAKALYDNRGVAGPEVDAARGVGNVNRFDGRLFPLSDNADGTMTVEAGTFDGTTFNPGGGPPANAVRAVATGKAVQFVAGNLMGAVLGNTATGSDITKEAIAAYGCGSNCQPQLPIMLCQGLVTNLDPTQPCDPASLNLGPLTQTPAPDDTSCWSCLSPGCSASTPTYLALFPPECGGTGSATASVGEDVGVSNGQNTPVLRQLLDCISPTSQPNGKNQHFFRVPVSTDCSHCNQNSRITNFVTLKIGCTDPACTDRDHCACTGTDALGRRYNTYDCSGAGCHPDPSNTDPSAPTTPAVITNGPTAGIYWAKQVCDTDVCTGVSFANCGGLGGFALIK